MTSKLSKFGTLISAFLAAVCISQAAEKYEEWVDPLGNSFKGQPSAIYGPLAIFKTGAATAKRIPLHFLNEADSVRFDQALKSVPQRASDWAQSTSVVSAQLKNRVFKVANGKITPASFAGVIEPELYIVFYANSSVGESWDMLGASIGKYNELQQQFPGMVTGVLFGINHGKLSQKTMAENMNMPWLVCDYDEEERMDALKETMPKDAPLMLVLSRDGAVFFGTNETKADKIGAVFTQVSELLKLMQPGNPASWSDRVHYFSALQKAQHQTGESAPILVGDPIFPDALKKYGVKKFTASIAISAQGAITDVTLAPGYDMPEKLAAKIPAALKKAAFVPAVKNGQFVDGTYTYSFSDGQ